MIASVASSRPHPRSRSRDRDGVVEERGEGEGCDVLPHLSPATVSLLLSLTVLVRARDESC
jgi:hypothetical protein